MRYTRAHAAELGLNMKKFVLTGGSAGGHLALMETEGAPSNAFADPTLPPELASTDPHIDATIAMVAPTDLSTFWQAGGIAPSASESLLGCTQDVAPAIPGMPACNDKVVDDYSPLVWTRRYVSDGRSLPPAYFAYGGADTLVKIDTQGIPNIKAWAKAAGSGTHVGRPSPERAATTSTTPSTTSRSTRSSPELRRTTGPSAPRSDRRRGSRFAGLPRDAFRGTYV